MPNKVEIGHICVHTTKREHRRHERKIMERRRRRDPLRELARRERAICEKASDGAEGTKGEKPLAERETELADH